jgi:hypothetical protein
MFIRFAALAFVAAAGTALAQDAAAPAPAPLTVKLGDLPAVLDHEATFEDAKADEKGVRRSVIMGGLDKITARSFRFEAPVGSTVKFKKLLITARTCYVRPPEETPETAVFVEVNEPPPQGGDELRRLFSGWMFASSPGLNALENPVYDVWVIGCRIDDPANPTVATTTGPTSDEPTDLPSVDDPQQADDGPRD